MAFIALFDEPKKYERFLLSCIASLSAAFLLCVASGAKLCFAYLRSCNIKSAMFIFEKE